MTEREMIADLRALIKRWEANVEKLESEGADPEALEVEGCIADLKELIP